MAVKKCNSYSYSYSYSYSPELIARAEYEMHIFERVSACTGNELIDEVKRLRAAVLDLCSAIDNVSGEAMSNYAHASDLSEKFYATIPK